MKFYKQPLFGIIVSVLVLLIACKNKSASGHKPGTTFKNDVALDSFFTHLNNKGMFNGAVAIKREGKLILKKGYGTANFQLNTPFIPSTAMEIASVSKQFTAAAILILSQKGKLSIDDFAFKYLGEMFPYHDIKIIHLLNHTAGLPDYEDHFKKTWDTTQIAYNDDIVNYFEEKRPPLMSRPSEKYHYSNSAYILLAEIVHKVSGKTLDNFLEKNIFVPSGISNSGFWERDSIWALKNYAPGYMIDPETCNHINPETLPGKQYYHFLSGRYGSGRLSSSIEDLIKWDSILYTDRIFNEESKELAFTPHPPQKDTSDYGFGWHVPDTVDHTVYHSGSWAGNKSYIKRFLDKKSLIIILNNTYSPYMTSIRKAVDGYIQNGSTLTLPLVMGHEQLKSDICNLGNENLKDWATKNQHLSWDMDKLKKQQANYRKNNQIEKANLVSLLVDHFSMEH